LRIGIDGNELDSAQASLNHAVDGIDATASDADDFDDCEVVVAQACHDAPYKNSCGWETLNLLLRLNCLPFL
jgi:hypothetical protein